MCYITKLKRIKKCIDNMKIENLKNVYNIINNNNQPITKKSDCFLINLGNLNTKTINELTELIDFLESNNKLLEQDELIKKQYADEIKYLEKD
jgi:hypothetical protein